MFLKKVLLEGFKSFADRTEFEFGAGMTGIVGPNGCGKSNVSDAIRWVLGEQSAKSLRGGRMMDVIFSGSRTRKPSASAHVELIFDNESRRLALDQDEVSVARLLYRNGDSEYRLNGKPVRLKDIRDLLLDTGIGTDAYSIIEQGRVDAMLQADPQQRREIFEEAAGISRYRVRRTEAQRKLERTQANLVRIHDIVAEVERRLRSVKLAAGKARSFQEYDQRLRELRSAHALAEYRQFRSTAASLSRRRQTLSDLLAAGRTDATRREQDASALEQQRAAFDEQIGREEARLAELQNEAAGLRERIVQNERRLTALLAARQRQEQRASEAVQQSEALARRIDEAGRELDALRDAERTDADRLGALAAQQRESQQRLEDLRHQLHGARSAAFESARAAALLQNQLANLEEQRQRAAQRASAVAQRLEHSRGERARCTAAVQDAAQRRAGLEQSLAELEASIDSAEQARAALQQRAQAADRDLASAKEERRALHARLDVLADLEQRMEGVDRGARWLLGWRESPEQSGGVIGLVADLLRVDDPRGTLLDPLLARFERHIVVRDAAVFLAELKRRGRPPGPIRVLALDRIGGGRRAWPDPAHGAGIVARPIEWVACEDAFRPLAERVLANVVLVDDVARALALAADAPAGAVCIAESGEVVESGGRIHVGGAEALPGLISRRREIRRLQEDISALELRLQQATHRSAQLREQMADEELRLRAIQEQRSAALRRIAETAGDQRRLADEAERWATDAAALEREADELAALVADAAAHRQRIEHELIAAQASCADAEQWIREQEAALADAQAELDRLARGATAAQVELGRAAERRASRETALQELLERQRQWREAHGLAQRERDEAARDQQQTQAELAAARSSLADLEQRAADQSRALAALREARLCVRRRLDGCSRSLRTLHEGLDPVESALRAAEADLREVDTRIENLLARVRDEMKVDLSTLDADASLDGRDWQAVQEEIEDLRGRIARLGHVNLDALAELDELTPRYDNLIAQRDDLTRSVAQLEQLIADLDGESVARFTAVFQQVRENFLDLFRVLFGGGKADILLENPEQPLESGIEIIARPPGKEPRSISLLSGGERTLAAVALLFAMFRSKPSPFAVLDEVDAALDESNIDRFTTMLRDFLGASQFIVITHSKRTMQCADALYGVTMGEPGISRRVSVRLDDRVETPVLA